MPIAILESLCSSFTGKYLSDKTSQLHFFMKTSSKGQTQLLSFFHYFAKRATAYFPHRMTFSSRPQLAPLTFPCECRLMADERRNVSLNRSMRFEVEARVTCVQGEGRSSWATLGNEREAALQTCLDIAPEVRSDLEWSVPPLHYKLTYSQM